MAITKTGIPVSEERRGRGRPQARPDEETRTVILNAARQEFAASGYAATSMESVAVAFARCDRTGSSTERATEGTAASW